MFFILPNGETERVDIVETANQLAVTEWVMIGGIVFLLFGIFGYIIESARGEKKT